MLPPPSTVVPEPLSTPASPPIFNLLRYIWSFFWSFSNWSGSGLNWLWTERWNSVVDVVMLLLSGCLCGCLEASGRPNFSIRSTIFVFSFSSFCVSIRPFVQLVVEGSSRPNGKLSKIGLCWGAAVLPWLVCEVSLVPPPGTDC